MSLPSLRPSIPLRWLGFDTDGPIAVGGSLETKGLIEAYRSGIFPWSSDPAITWWCPDPRAVFDLETFASSRTVRKTVRQAGWTFHVDRDFIGTMQHCAEATSTRPETWITNDFIAAYKKLHDQNLAHSVEVYENEELIGGLYGVSMGGFFGGESMFHRRPNASKAALSFLVEHLKIRGFILLDAQVMNPHLASLGAIEISRWEYLDKLKQALQLPVTF